MAATSNVTIDQVIEFANALAERVDALEALVKKGGSGNRSTNKTPTPRIESPELAEFAAENPGVLSEGRGHNEGVTGTYVYDVTGRTKDELVADRNTGLQGFWITYGSGKPGLVDVLGVPFFLENPLREGLYDQDGKAL